MSAEIQGSPEWHEARRLPEPASAIAALTGEHPYLTIPKYVRQRVRQLARVESEFVMVPAVAHGQIMEDTARRFLEKLINVKVRETGSVVHPEYDFIQASADGLIGLDACCEFKCPYPYYTKTPYSIFDKKRSMYLTQVYMQMECLDVDECHFICYLAKSHTAEPQYTYELVKRPDNWLGELLDGKLLPTPASGKVSRIDLYREWHEFILAEYEDEGRRKKHVEPVDKAKAVAGDTDLDLLTATQVRIDSLVEKMGDDLTDLTELKKTSDEIKKLLGERYKESVTNGKTLVKVIHKTASVDYRKAFNFLNGEQILLDQGDSIEAFKRESGLMQIQVINEDSV
jgi:putative phage-type endonuclease